MRSSESSKRPTLALPETICAIKRWSSALSDRPAPLYRHLEPNAPCKRDRVRGYGAVARDTKTEMRKENDIKRERELSGHNTRLWV